MGSPHAERNSALMTEGLGLLMLTELPRTLGQGFHGQQLTSFRLGDRAHFDQHQNLRRSGQKAFKP
jgi:hypothetical protein